MSEQEQATQQTTDTEPTPAESPAQQPEERTDLHFDDDDEDQQVTGESPPLPEESEQQSDDQKEEPRQEAINQEAVDKRINKLTFEKYEERRKREKIEQELEQARQKIAAQTQQEVIVPEMPDAFDPNFDQKIKARDEALRQQAMVQAKRDAERQRSEQAQRQKLESDRETITGYVNSMFSEAKKIGIKEADLRQADDTVAMFIKDQGLARFILSQKEAPQIITQLAGNIAELESISKMDPISAAAHIASNVIPRAKSYKASISKTPEPLDIPKGKANSAKPDKFTDGYTFE